jgi:hypothetical protein
MSMTQRQAEALAAAHMAAFDVLVADRLPVDTAATHILASLKAGRDPLAEAKHFVTLRKAFRGES